MLVFFVYIITNKPNGVLYIGVTNSIERRMYEHKTKRNKSFSSRYNLDKLVYFETFQSPIKAIKKEKQLKKWNRAWKISLIEKENPNWNDLSSNWNFSKFK